MNSTHTPGPWIAQLHFRQRDGAREYAMVTANGHLVPLAGVLLRVDNYDDGHGEANARLIAAAPDMLDLLKWLDRKGGLGLDVHERIISVIAKATGASNG
jgi:hypothetical protein